MAMGPRSTSKRLVPQIALSVQMLVPQIALLEERVFVPQMALVPQIARRSVTPVPQMALVPQIALSMLTTTLPWLSCDSEGLMAGCVAVTVQLRAAGIFRYPAPKVQGSAAPLGKPHLSALNIRRALIVSGERLGLACSSRAAAPETTGAAIEVPESRK